MNIVVRADASTNIGAGHIMRCLTLVHSLKSVSSEKKIQITFICHKLPEYLKQKILNESFELIELKRECDNEPWTQENDSAQCINILSSLPTTDLLIQDHYRLNAPWQELISPFIQKLLVIDDLANRKHKTDYLLDQAFGRLPEDYTPWVDQTCQLLTGHSFILLRSEFSKLISTAFNKRNNTDTIENILISLGGMDVNNISEKAIKSVINLQNPAMQTEQQKQKKQYKLNLVMSSAATHLDKIKKLIKPHSWISLHIDTNEMAKLMLDADIAIGASGTSAWERCSLGLPTLSIVLADNQSLVSANLAKQGAIINLGLGEEITVEGITTELIALINDKNKYHLMSEKCFKCCDGEGTYRVKNQLFNVENKLLNVRNKVQLIPATIDDQEKTFLWQSNTSIRRYFNNPATPTWEQHSQWFEKNLTDPSSSLYMIHSNKLPVGTLRLDKQHNNEYEISILIDPTKQGKGLALNALNQLPFLIKNGTFIAIIHKDNISSQNVFKKAGFSSVSTTRYCLKIKAHKKVSL